MSSRLTPPKVGTSSWTARTISSGSWVSRQMGKASTPAKALKRTALPSMTGMAAFGPMLPSPSTADRRTDGHEIPAPSIPVHQRRIGVDRPTRLGDAGGVGGRESCLQATSTRLHTSILPRHSACSWRASSGMFTRPPHPVPGPWGPRSMAAPGIKKIQGPTP